MKLIFIFGLPATGKLTVAKQLEITTGYKLFHNHLVVDLLLSVFDFGTPPFVQLREQIWLSVFDQACQAHLPGLIFTFAPEKTVCPTFIERTVTTVTMRGGQVHFVELVCPLSELTNRIDNSSRREYQKLASVELFHQLNAVGTFNTPTMPQPALSIDTSHCTPSEAANQIARTLQIL